MKLSFLVWRPEPGAENSGSEMSGLGEQLVGLLILGLPVACVTWTITHEEVLRELREWCSERSKTSARLYQRKFFYLLTCEYCFSHYIAALFIGISRFQVLLAGWRGYLIAWLSLVWIANTYMSLFGRLRLDIKQERLEIAAEETFPGGTGAERRADGMRQREAAAEGTRTRGRAPVR